ncbi:MAG TPA: hypothetical protein VN193_11805 [Candidatus Angelobacter sp.]|jgi:hypothetical protein|nr:hypothetical protein [Candidatus Angelobacter sp.]
MESTMEHELQLRLLRQARAAFTGPASGERPGDHLHFDRRAHAWRTHEELGRPAVEAGIGRESAVMGCS